MLRICEEKEKDITRQIGQESFFALGKDEKEKNFRKTSSQPEGQIAGFT